VAEQEAAQKLGEGLTQEQASVLQEAKETLQQELDSVVEKQVLEVEALGKAHAEALAIVTAQAAVAQQELEVCVEERKASLAGPAKAAQEAKTAAAALEKELEKVQWLVANSEFRMCESGRYVLSIFFHLSITTPLSFNTSLVASPALYFISRSFQLVIKKWIRVSTAKRFFLCLVNTSLILYLLCWLLLLCVAYLQIKVKRDLRDRGDLARKLVASKDQEIRELRKLKTQQQQQQQQQHGSHGGGGSVDGFTPLDALIQEGQPPTPPLLNSLSSPLAGDGENGASGGSSGGADGSGNSSGVGGHGNGGGCGLVAFQRQSSADEAAEAAMIMAQVGVCEFFFFYEEHLFLKNALLLLS
jgi:hypothetical protein